MSLAPRAAAMVLVAAAIVGCGPGMPPMPEAEVVNGRVIAAGDSFPSGLERRALDEGAVLAVPLERVEELWAAVDIEEPSDATTPGRFTIDAASAERIGAVLDPVDDRLRLRGAGGAGTAAVALRAGNERRTWLTQLPRRPKEMA